ncbi:MAG: hypothetical protein QXR03_05065 [Candidatus Aenigmatarchaeota archaeon]
MKLQNAKKKALEKAFKKFWLKYANYDKCIEKLKKIGFNVTKGYLMNLRIKLKLPEMREILLRHKNAFIVEKMLKYYSA